MKKKFLSLLFTVLMIISAIPLSIFAASGTVSSCIDLTAMDNDAFGKGYEWDNLDCVLILTDMNLDTSNAFGIKLPADSTIILNGNSTVTATAYGIQCLGALTIKGEGTLTVNAGQNGISAVSSQEKHSVVFRSGTVTVNGAKNGIYAENSELVFSGATVKVTANENSIFGKNIKIVSGSLELTGKIKAKGTLTVSNTDLSVAAIDKAIDAVQGVTFKDVTISAGETLSTLKNIDIYNGEKAIKTDGIKKDIKKGFLFQGALPAFVDYMVIIALALALIAVVIVPIVVKRKKTAALIRQSEAAKASFGKKAKKK